jgi:hypothetical protein
VGLLHESDIKAVPANAPILSHPESIFFIAVISALYS